jgi:hypothetical protein
MSVEKIGPEGGKEINANRLPFDVEFYQQADDFCVTLLEQIPELNAIALVPLWNNQPENTPPGLLRLRDPQAPYLASLLKLLTRLAAFSVDVQRDLIAQIKIFDNYAAQLAEKIREQNEALANNKETPSPDAEQ